MIDSDLFIFNVLSRLNLATLSRLMPLHRSYTTLITNESFWRRHIERTITPRYTNEVVNKLGANEEKIISGGHRPWYTYALIFSPRKATKVYHTGKLLPFDASPGHPTPQPIEVEGPVLGYHQDGNRIYELLADHRLIVSRPPGSTSSAKYIFSDVAHSFRPSWRSYYVSTSGELYHENDKMRLVPVATEEAVVDVSGDFSIVTFSTVSGKLFLFTPPTFMMPLSVGATPIIKHTTVYQISTQYVIYTLDTNGVLTSHQIDLNSS
jgi:hypothetical protein